MSVPVRRYLPSTEERFWAKVDQSEADGCWPFMGYRSPGGYGEAYVSETDTSMRAHRLAWMLAYGAIPPGLLVCHRCDNPPCCRPTHLFLGTSADNSRDMVAKGRGRGRCSLPILLASAGESAT